MATTTNYGWTTPDDTSLVKDGAAAIRTLGSSVDTTTKALNPSTTLGDIEYRSSTANTNTRLGIGSTGNVLTVAGGVPTWAAPAGGAASYSLLNAGGTALTGATTITVSGISGKEDLIIVLNAASTANGSGANFGVRVNGLTTNVYYGVGQYNTADSPYTFNMFAARNYANTTSYLPLARVTDGSATASGAVTLSGCNSTGLKTHISVGGANPGASYNQYFYSLQGYIDASAAITSVSVFSDDGNFDGGTLYVYGA
jgi:hypothetical protein